MGKSYDLIDLDTGNLVGSYATELQALKDVVSALDAYGHERVASLALVWANASGAGGGTIAEGTDLESLAVNRLVHQAR